MGLKRRLALIPLVGVLALPAACGGGSHEDPQALLTEAKKTLDSTEGLHFELTSSNTPSKGTVLTGGSGEVVRPDKFKGTLRVSLNALAASVAVISAGGKVYIKIPLVPVYREADPEKYGFSDPGLLLDPDSGLSSLIGQATDVKSAGTALVNGDKVDEVEVTLP